MMQDFIKNIFYLGAGAAFMTKDKMEELKKDLIDKGRMTQDEGKKFVDDLMKKSEEAKEDLEKRIHEIVTERLDKMHIATKDDIKDLQAQIDTLRSATEQKQASGTTDQSA